MIISSGDVSSRTAAVVDDDDDDGGGGGGGAPAAFPNDDDDDDDDVVAASPPPANPPPKCPSDDAIDSIDGRDPARDDDGDETAASDPSAFPSRPADESTATNDDDDDGCRPDVDPALRRRAAMETNVALEALESMRRVNLELEFVNAIATIATSTRAISPFPVRHDDCTWCQREALRRHVVSCDAAAVADEEEKETTRRPRGGSRVRRFNGGVGGLFSWNNAGDDDDRDDDDGKSEPVAVEDDGDVARRWSDGIRINRSAFGVGGLSSKRGAVGKNDGDDGEVEPVLVKDENSRRLDGSRIRRFNSNVGSIFAKRTAGDESSKAEPVVVKFENPRRLDGSRIRSFNNNVGSFFSRNKADDGKSAETTTQSRIDGDVCGLFSKNDAGDNNDDDSKSEETTKENDAGNIDDKSEVTQPQPINSHVGGVSSRIIVDNNDEETVGIDDDKAKPDRRRAHRFDSNVSSLKSKPTQSRPPPLRNIMQKASPCLTCGHPTCPRHSSSAFSKKNIPMCQLCAYLFELDFIVDMIASAASSSDFTECRRRVNEMVDCYDRAVLLLSYMAVYAEDVATALEAQAARSNKIGAGSGATSIISSIAGIVGCGVLIFVGHGVPLLIASLVVSGGATAAQTGDEVVKYFSEPNRLAERMVALHGMATSLLRVKDVLSHVLLKRQHRSDGEFPKVGDEEGSARRDELAGEIKALLDKHNVAAGASSVGNGSKFIGRGTRYFGRVCSTAAFIPVAGGLLSAATIYFEGNELKRTLSRISEGNPCAKAEQVRSIADELDMLPESSLVLEECRIVFELAQKEKTGNSSSAFTDINEFDN